MLIVLGANIVSQPVQLMFLRKWMELANGKLTQANVMTLVL
jgi:hypothetical protein